MAKLIIIPDDHYIKSINNTYLAYDLDSLSLTSFEAETSLLHDTNLEGSASPFRPFGVCKYNDGIAVISHGKLVVYKDGKIESIDKYPLFLNSHQICSDEEALYVANTSVDTIGIHHQDKSNYFNVRTKEFSSKCNPSLTVYLEDRKHVNSLTLDGGYLYYCLHNLNVEESSFGRIDLKTMSNEHLFKCGSCCHDVVILDGYLYSNSSCNGFLIKHNIKDKTTETFELVDPLTLFLRGMVSYEGNLLIGVSNNHMSECSPLNSNIFKFNPKTNDYSLFMPIPDVLSIADMTVIQGEV